MSDEKLAYLICEGMWGRELAELYQKNGDIRWADALRTAAYINRKMQVDPPVILKAVTIVVMGVIVWGLLIWHWAMHT